MFWVRVGIIINLLFAVPSHFGCLLLLLLLTIVGDE